jgi:hypothetical protein
MVTSEELIVTTECVTLCARYRLNRCRYTRVRLYILFTIYYIQNISLKCVGYATDRKTSRIVKASVQS